MCGMEKIATDIYTFAELRKNGFTYVDKTDALYAMASGESGKQFFIARPRRFGKSLAVSIGVNVNGEVQTHDGRIDMVVDLPDDIYIVEFKLDRPAAGAMEQIKGKDYAGKYAMSKKRITLIGISFSSEKRTIVEDLVEEFEIQERKNT